MVIETGVDLDKTIELTKFARIMVGHDTDNYMLSAGKTGNLIKERLKKQKINNM